MDNIGFWNIRGLNSLNKQKEIKWFLHSNKIGLFGLIETRVKSSNWIRVRNNICSSWAISTNNGVHKGGRVWLIWNPAYFEVDIKDITSQTIHSAVWDKANDRRYWLTIVYGFNKAVLRRELWKKLIEYAGSCSGAWAIGGDFNNVLSFHERIGSDISVNEIQPFQDCLDICQVKDITAIGSFFTWNNKQEVATRVYNRIDRFLINDEWMHLFPDAYANFMPEGIFDHCPCVVQFTEQLTSKLKMLKYKLKMLNKDSFNDIENNSDIVLMALQNVQKELRAQPMDPTLVATERALSKEYDIMMEAKHQFLAQKAKAEWVADGDDNIAYFHASIRAHRNRSKVVNIIDMNGNCHSSAQGINEAFENYYKVILGTQKSVASVHVPTV
ncbi:uncharacterized protein LOC141613430 [Silene latifolia]|uniref:uncharacterized protein LOC141613430 n=1 Tax=Silene latifolia TaxID=37657 RepID=UPI003D780111